MALSAYKKKRNFQNTGEPQGGKAAQEGKLVFVVQQHAASHLHYDFRLEMEGVLKSWAVPKGPSLNPEDKRLAMMVEDHPYDYKDFEGNIPAGNYGAGNVIVWDNGSYHALGGNGANDEKLLLAGLKKGHITFILEGHKLKGEFALVKLKNKQENAWLLVKKNDEFAKQSDVLKQNKSVLTGETLEALIKRNGDTAHPDKPGKLGTDRSVKKKPAR
jgi:bifunctional non-homologous end joining protein LigD